MNIIVYLENDVEAFRVTDALVDCIGSRFPRWTFTRVTNEILFVEQLSRADLVITWEFKAQWYYQAPKLKAIFTPAAGHDWIERVDDFQVTVFHGSFHGAVMAESLLAMILYFNRRIPQTLLQQKNHIWDREFLNHTCRLVRQHVVIVGYGNIARECARVLKVFGCRITGVKHSPYDSRLDKDADTICHPNQLPDILGNCDHLVSILPGTESNLDFFNKERLSAIKPGAFFYSIGRGNCCKDETILWALDNGLIAGAGLDVFYYEPLAADSPLWDHPNVLTMPHGAAIVQDYLPMYFEEITEILKRFVD
ncbi:MAG TPA: NAD(P)-dependent oxidoreductase [Chitinispirillaceae bacterium]|nr:NAD(P)-dependent oxidoreductase [Chitinispirillaceae bacterium]